MAMHGRNVCYMHGGKSPRGLASPQTTHGRYSQDIPTRLAGRYLASQSDPDLLNLKSEISLVDARLAELLQQVQHIDNPMIWESIQPMIEQRRKLVESEAKRRVQMQDMISSERAILLISAIAQIVMRHVDDTATRAAISADIGALLNRESPAAT